MLERTITLPEFTDDELQKDTIRGYNGFAGKDAFKLPLHEFRVPVDSQGLLIVIEQPDGKTGTVSWERVPAADRPQAGDPNYVNNELPGSATFPALAIGKGRELLVQYEVPREGNTNETWVARYDTALKPLGSPRQGSDLPQAVPARPLPKEIPVMDEFTYPVYADR